MKNNLTFENLKPRLISLGLAFYGETDQVSDPEQTLVDAVRLAPKEPKLFRMILAWMEKARELVHVERMRSLVNDLADDELVALGTVALKQVKAGDRRFSLLVDFSRKKMKSANLQRSAFSEGDDPFLISKYGLDEELSTFGVKSARISPADEKKVLTLEAILKQNSWLRFRALIGANFRADVAYVMAHKLATNPYRAAKIVGCSMETSYRLWRGLMLYPKIEFLAK